MKMKWSGGRGGIGDRATAPVGPSAALASRLATGAEGEVTVSASGGERAASASVLASA
jgi:hypothetical protein